MSDVGRLGAALHGAVLRPGDEGYDRARRVWNARVDRRPALIVRPRHVADVVEAVGLAADRALPLAVRGGGHSPAGYGTVDDGIVIDLSSMNRIDVDPDGAVARAEAGLTWGEYNAHTHAHGLATPGGDVASVGIAGLTLGGGMGWLMRRHGLTIDNLLAVELVTADGRTLTASETEHPDLFWALRGGGGNFGVATAFEYRLHPVATVLGGALVHRATRDGLRAFAETVVTAPDGLTTLSMVGLAPPLPFIPAEAHGTPVHMIFPCHTGDVEAGERAVAPLRSLGGQTPLSDLIGPRPYRALHEMTAMGQVSRPHAARNAFLSALTDDVIEIVLAAVDRATSPFGLITIRELGGAVGRVPVDATAFAHRDKGFYLAVDNAWEDPADPDRHTAWVDACWDALAPHTDGVYAGYLEHTDDDMMTRAFPPATLTRLVDVKRRYDPGNLFRLNPNIRPN